VKLINDLRMDLAPEQKIFPLPFAGGKLASHPYDKDADIFREFNENLEKVYEDLDRHGLVETKGLKVKGNSTLFENDSMIELGRRYAESMSYLYGIRKIETKKK
ncbi:MAG: sialate O-acetylesterase, partial [Victivallales bacterium]